MIRFGHRDGRLVIIHVKANRRLNARDFPLKKSVDNRMMNCGAADQPIPTSADVKRIGGYSLLPVFLQTQVGRYGGCRLPDREGLDPRSRSHCRSSSSPGLAFCHSRDNDQELDQAEIRNPNKANSSALSRPIAIAAVEPDDRLRHAATLPTNVAGADGWQTFQWVRRRMTCWGRHRFTTRAQTLAPLPSTVLHHVQPRCKPPARARRAHICPARCPERCACSPINA